MVSKTFWGGAALAALLASSPTWAAPSGQAIEPTAAPASANVTPPSRKRIRTTRRSSEPAAATEVADETVPEAQEIAPARRSGRRGVHILPPPRPAELAGTPVQEAPTSSGFDIRPTLATGSLPAPAAAPPIAPTNWFSSFFGLPSAQPRGTQLPPLAGRGQIDALISHHAKLNGVPDTLVHRVVVRESRYNSRAVGRGGAMGLMQIKTATARAVGYDGGPAGLLDAETNLTYGVKYLAGAYRTAGGNHDLAVSHYARGYYYAARRQGLVEVAARRGRRGTQKADATPAPAVDTAPSFFSFASRTASAADDRSAR